MSKESAQIDLLRSIKSIQDILDAINSEKPSSVLIGVAKAYVEEAKRNYKKLFPM